MSVVGEVKSFSSARAVGWRSVVRDCPPPFDDASYEPALVAAYALRKIYWKWLRWSNIVRIFAAAALTGLVIFVGYQAKRGAPYEEPLAGALCIVLLLLAATLIRPRILFISKAWISLSVVEFDASSVFVVRGWSETDVFWLAELETEKITGFVKALKPDISSFASEAQFFKQMGDLRDSVRLLKLEPRKSCFVRKNDPVGAALVSLISAVRPGEVAPSLELPAKSPPPGALLMIVRMAKTAADRYEDTIRFINLVRTETKSAGMQALMRASSKYPEAVKTSCRSAGESNAEQLLKEIANFEGIAAAADEVLRECISGLEETVRPQVERVEGVRKSRLEEVNRRFGEQIERQRRMYDERLSELELERNRVSQQCEWLREQKRSCQKERDLIRDRLDRLNEEKDKLRSEISAAESAYDRLAASVRGEKSGDAETAKDAEDPLATIRQLTDKIQSMKGRMIKLSGETGATETALREAESRVKEAAKRWEDSCRALRDVEQRIDGVTRQKNSEINQLARQRDLKIEEINAECDQEIRKIREHIIAFDAERKQMLARIADSAPDILGMRSQLEKRLSDWEKAPDISLQEFRSRALGSITSDITGWLDDLEKKCAATRALTEDCKISSSAFDGAGIARLCVPIWRVECEPSRKSVLVTPSVFVPTPERRPLRFTLETNQSDPLGEWLAQWVMEEENRALLERNNLLENETEIEALCAKSLKVLCDKGMVEKSFCRFIRHELSRMLPTDKAKRLITAGEPTA